jgi:cobalt-zinc-cadmium efflux system membrane fusion protein
LAYQREKKLKEEKISAARDFLEAEAAYEVAKLKSKMARQKLLNLGFSDGEIVQIAKDQDSSSTIKLRAPFAGTLVAREAVVGEAVYEGKALFKVTDLSTLWLDISLSPEHADSVEVGQILTARFDGDVRDIEYTGVITWVDSAIDPRNRMLKARAEIQNPDGAIRQGMFGHAELALTWTGKAVLLPRDAIQHHEGRPYVFVKEAPDLYALRHVSLGQSGNDTVAVTEGLGADELVVTKGAFIAMSEFLKSRLGAGCVDD